MTKTEPTLSTFDFSGLELRVIMHLSEPWFIAADVCDALGMDRKAGTGRWLRGLAQDESRYVERTALPQLFCGSRAPTYTAISESGLYKLIMRSDKPEAHKFQDWVTREVLPAIRKTGGYLLNEEARETAKADDRQAMPNTTCSGYSITPPP
jgi:prophage antirepressor-like protein